MLKHDHQQIERTAQMLRKIVDNDDPFGDSLAAPDGPILPLDDKPPKRIPILDLPSLIASGSAQAWVVKGIIPADSVGMIFGASGAFKSFVALDLGLHIAHGMQWMGRKTKQGCVIYIAAEGGTGLWKRVKAWHQLRGVEDGESIPFYTIPSAVDILADVDAIVEAVNSVGATPDLVIIDTLSQTFSGEENSAPEVASYMRAIGTAFRERWHCATAIIHHVGHVATERPRGSSALLANTDWMYGVFRDAEAMVATFSCVKQKDGDKIDDAQFTLSTHKLGVDDDGDDITSLAARHIGDPEEAVEIVRKEIRQGKSSHNSTLARVAISGMTEKELRTAFYEACDGDNSEAKKKAFQRALKWAKSNMFFVFENGCIRILQPI